MIDTGVGNDRVDGGAGVDTITDHAVVDDRIRLDSGVFPGLPGGRLAGTAFAANLTGAATTALHRVICETDTGQAGLRRRRDRNRGCGWSSPASAPAASVPGAAKRLA